MLMLHGMQMQIAFFEAQQATAAEFIAAYNADVIADDAAAAALTASDAATATVAYLDLDTADSTTAVTMGLMGAGFTLTEVANAAAPTEAEVAAEVLALATAATASQEVVDGAATALTAATTAAAGADGAVDLSLTITGAIVVAADGGITAEVETVGADVIATNVGGTITLDAAFLAEADQAILDLVAASQAKEDADLVDAAADLAVSDFGTLVTNFSDANNVNPLTAGLGTAEVGSESGLLGDVASAEIAISDFADAISELDAATADSDELVVLEEAVTAAETALEDAGYDSIITVDAASEFGTSADDVFVVGTVDSSIYSINLQGSDTVFVGTDAAYNSTLIGSDDTAGETLLADAGDVAALELFLVTNGADVDVIIETENYGSETSDYTTIKLVGADLADVTVADGFITVA